jgi:hypothetical protein
MQKNNLIYIEVYDKYLGFMDTGGGFTFLFRKPELSSKLKLKYLETDELNFLHKNVIVFIGNDYWKKRIYEFNYLQNKFHFIDKIPKNLTSYKMYNKKQNFAILKILFNGKSEKFLFDTGATLTRKKKNHGISFLDGVYFDLLLKENSEYKVIKNYDDDGSPVMIIPEITIFDKTIKDVMFLRRNENAFYKWMSSLTGIKHVGAIGGNVLQHYKIIADFKNKLFYV